MLIHLFQDEDLINKSSTKLGQLRTRNCDIITDLSHYHQEVAASADAKFHIDSVIKTMHTSRSYREIFGKITDSHSEIEKLGVCKYAREYTAIVSLEDSLDYILHRLSGADVSKIRNIFGYREISRGLLKLNYEVLEFFNFSSLFDVDTKLNSYLDKLLEQAAEGEVPFLNLFIQDVLTESSKVIEYIGFFYNDTLPDSAIRSKTFCSFIISTATHVEDEILIHSQGKDDYRIKVRSFKKGEYLNKTDILYIE